MIASAAALAATLAPAQAQFTSVTDFGDSYADTGSAPGGAFRCSVMAGFPVPCRPRIPTCRFTGSTNFVDSLQTIYGLPTATNYAIGGARTNDTNTIPGLHGFTYELATIRPPGGHFANSDLIAAVDRRQRPVGHRSTSCGDPKRRDHIGQAEVAGVQQLVAAGAHNIVIFGTGSSKYFPVPPAGADTACRSPTRSATTGRTPTI